MNLCSEKEEKNERIKKKNQETRLYQSDLFLQLT
jgi:hypothetical protein